MKINKKFNLLFVCAAVVCARSVHGSEPKVYPQAPADYFDKTSTPYFSTSESTYDQVVCAGLVHEFRLMRNQPGSNFFEQRAQWLKVMLQQNPFKDQEVLQRLR